MKQLLLSTLLIAGYVSKSQATYYDQYQEFCTQPFSSYTTTINYAYDPLIQSSNENPGFRYYIQEERAINFTGSLEQYTNLFAINKLIIKNPIIDQNIIKKIDFSTIQRIDFSQSSFPIAKSFFQSVLNSENRTLISLENINFGTIVINYELLELIQSITENLKFNNNALIRPGAIVDQYYSENVASVIIQIYSDNLKDLKTSDRKRFKNILEPSAERFSTIYMDNISREYLPRLKLYVTDTNSD